MPTIVDALPKTSRGRARKYDYESLYNELLKSGKAAQLVQGDDFTCTGASMRQFLYRDTSERGLKVKVRSTKDEGDHDVITFSVERDNGDRSKGDKSPPKDK